jgi:hypothetical protein
MVDPHQAEQIEHHNGRNIWPTISDADWAKLKWVPTSRTSTDLVEIADQRATLELWAATKDQPIRNVEFFRRSFHLPTWDKVIDG